MSPKKKNTIMPLATSHDATLANNCAARSTA